MARTILKVLLVICAALLAAELIFLGVMLFGPQEPAETTVPTTVTTAPETTAGTEEPTTVPTTVPETTEPTEVTSQSLRPIALNPFSVKTNFSLNPHASSISVHSSKSRSRCLAS